MNGLKILKEFVRNGIRFECEPGCIKCCAIPGIVFVKSDEIPRMAAHFELSEADFKKQYLRPHWGDVYTLNFPDVEPCMFLTDNGCKIYEVRPAQCRTFPFWPENLTNASAWSGVRKLCPGVGSGRTYLLDEIADIMEEVCFGPFL